MQEPSIGIRVSVECSTTTTAQQREGFDRVFGHYGLKRRTRGKSLSWPVYARLVQRHPLLRFRITHAWNAR